jgi:tRNA A37 threonylcarbamoyladenosine biosynthesis protein TsaE
MLLDDYTLCIVEWPERAERLLPEHTLHLYFEVVEEHSRKITIADK